MRGAAPAPIRPLARRVLKFHAVGLAGAAVQLVALGFLRSVADLNYLAATALAVEVSVLHNFCWHERWTWVERTRQSCGLGFLLRRLARFNFTTGLVSISSNLILMRLFVGALHLHYLPANVLAISITSLANFLLSEHFVFRLQTH